MTTLHLTLPDGQERSVPAEDGLTIMEVLRPLDVGILGTCDGSAICASCHVQMDAAWLDRLTPPSEDELETLDNSVPQATSRSRLGCQIRVGPNLDGLRLAIPAATVTASISDDSSNAATVAGAPVAATPGPEQAPSTPKDAVAGPPSARTRLKRYNWLAQYERETIDAIIDAGIVCQVGYVIDGMPYVTPTNHWRIDDYVYWHGSSASRMLKNQQKGIPVCFTVTHLDGIVFSRAAFNHNVMYRSVMAFGEAELCDEETKREALRTFTDRMAPGLWDYARPPTDQEWKASKVIRMKLDEVSGKVADGLPDEDADDLASDLWAGFVPLRMTQLPVTPDPKLKEGIPMPEFIANFRYVGVKV